MQEYRDLHIQCLNKGIVDLDIAYRYFLQKGGRVDAETFTKYIELLPDLKRNVVQTLNIHFNVVTLIQGDRIIKYY